MRWYLQRFSTTWQHFHCVSSLIEINSSFIFISLTHTQAHEKHISREREKRKGKRTHSRKWLFFWALCHRSVNAKSYRACDRNWNGFTRLQNIIFSSFPPPSSHILLRLWWNRNWKIFLAKTTIFIKKKNQSKRTRFARFRCQRIRPFVDDKRFVSFCSFDVWHCWLSMLSNGQ